MSSVYTIKHSKSPYNALKSGSHLPKKIVLFASLKALKNHEKCLLFHLKSSFRSQDIYVSVMNFWSCRKNDLIRNERLTSKFMASQPGYQTITMQILPNILRSKDNQAMKLGELIEYNEKIIVL